MLPATMFFTTTPGTGLGDQWRGVAPTCRSAAEIHPAAGRGAASPPLSDGPQRNFRFTQIRTDNHAEHLGDDLVFHDELYMLIGRYPSVL